MILKQARKITILIVEDSEVDRSIYIRYLQSNCLYSCSFIEANTLESGLEQWNSQKPDLVLLDLLLPDGDGLEFLEAVRTRKLETILPIIILTGQGDESVAVRAIQLGAVDYLVKGTLNATYFCNRIEKAYDRIVLNGRLVRAQQQEYLVAEVALRIRQYLDSNAILQAIVQEVRQFLTADRVIVYRFHADMSGSIVAEDILPPWEPTLNTQVIDTCFQENLGGAYREGRVFAAPDIYQANLTACHLQLLERFQVRANLVVPIFLMDGHTQLWGLLIAHQCSGPRHWDEMEIRLLQQLAVQLAIAIQQVNLYQSLQAANASLEQEVEERTLALTISEQKFRGVFNQTFQLAAVLDLNGTLIDANQTSLTFKGLQLEDVVNRPFWETPWWDISQAVRNQLQEAISRAAQGEFIRYEVEISNRHNQMVPIDFSLSPLRNEQGQTILLIAESRDISHSKQTEETLRFQAQILDQISDAVISTDLDGTICTWNKGAETLYGYSASEVIGQNVSILYDNPAEVEMLVLEPLLQNRSHEIEVRVRSKVGDLLYVSLRLASVYDHQGNLIRLIGCGNNITRRKQAESALQNSQLSLQRSEEFNRLAVEGGRIGTWDLIPTANTCFISPQMAELMGYSPDQTVITLSQLQAAVIPADQAILTTTIFETTEPETSFDLEVRIKRPDADVAWLYLRGRKTLNQAGNLLRVRGVAIDITKRKAIEAAHQAAEAQLQQLNTELEAKIADRTTELRRLSERLTLALKSGEIGCWDWDIQQNILHWDARMYELYGLEKTTNTPLSYELWLSYLHPDDQKVVAHYNQSLRNTQDYQQEFRIIRPDGQIYFIQAYGLILRDVQGNPTGMIGINFDISDRKRTEANLRKSQAHLLAAQRIARLGSWEFNLKTCEISGSEKTYEIFGHKTEDGPPTPEALLQFIHPEDRSQVEQKVQKMLQEGQAFEANYRLYLADGSLRYILSRAELVLSDSGEPCNLVGTVLDITEQKQAEAELQRINECLTVINAELDRATRSKDEFLANMSHELRTPLNSILGMAEALQDQFLGELNERQQHALHVVETSGKHLLELINDILDIAKISAGKMDIEPVPVSVKKICNDSLLFVRQQAFQKEIQLTSNVPDNLEPFLVDERRIRQALINLLMNAIKFTPQQGQVCLKVSVGCDGLWMGSAVVPESLKFHDSLLIIFQVTDTGIGISPTDASKLFQPFVQVSTGLNRQHTGTGLGLAMVKQIVELHRGQVMLDSQPGQGSCFTIALPYKHSLSDVSSEPSVASSQLININAGEENAPLILLAEDNEANLASLESYLNARHYRLTIARNGAEAVAKTKAEQPDLILMDIQMPGIDGLEAIQLIRAEAQSSTVPIIALTALAMPGDEERCLAAGANQYLTKPLTFKYLIKVMQQLLNRA